VNDAPPLVPRGVGAVVSIPYGPVAEWLTGAGYGWLVIDAEHAPVGPNEQLALVTAANAAGVAAYVRVAANDERAIGFALDAGADGVIVPNVTSATEARRAAMACRYPPAGVRSIGPIRRLPTAACCIVQIETVDAVGSAADLAAVDGIHALMIGPGDLALDAGLRPGIDNHDPAMIELYRTVRTASTAAGKSAGTFALLGEDDIKQALQLDWDFVTSCLDRLALTQRAHQLRTAGESG
jgi:4-hydroxy-2-oxoheptanedioate aldolase